MSELGISRSNSSSFLGLINDGLSNIFPTILNDESIILILLSKVFQAAEHSLFGAQILEITT